MLDSFSVHETAKEGIFKNTPLLVAGPGPGWDLIDWEIVRATVVFHQIFALNHAYLELQELRNAWWVSNDHDNTFNREHVSKVVPPRLSGKPWRTITQKIFVPGDVGEFDWIDHRGKAQKPREWRLDPPAGSTIAHYVAGEFMQDHPEWIHNGSSVLELALEVATLWQFSPIILVGCDMTMNSPQEYYAKPFRFKETPAKIVRGKLNEARESVVKHRERWSPEIYIVSDLWEDPPFHKVSATQGLRILNGDQPWSRG